ncbi:glycerophosphodiester phosphodiesterase family protein [Marinilactibacillus sp. Marseille-P9653]|uniref:glycerophosphodiester phosphodiesterase family protein n=1 Tax=Marinilactibacillus sp. Marseille-P9653 TaxID=2866583 RepID=UPI001CE48179|nr:glycerophosphodiester phosphodiesterase family protein [Marinilactibacillus sp. Marseille-P9653]
MFRKYLSAFIVLFLCIGIVVLLYTTVYSKRFSPKLPNNFALIAHRGASAYAPEHTLPAFQMAFEMDADYLEIDLQQTKDGELVVMHDETLERTTNGQGYASDYTYEEIENLDAGTWFNETYPDKADKQFENTPIVRLETLFQEYGQDANYYIETKSPDLYSDMEETLLALLEKYNLLTHSEKTKNILIQSFSADSLKKIHQLKPEVPLIQLYNFKNTPAQLTPEEWLDVSSYATGIGVNYTALNKDFSEEITSKNLLLHVYTINSYKDGLYAYEMGADGIFTDDLKEFENKD